MDTTKLSLRGLFLDDPHETPAGLLVPGKSMDPLIKAEAKKEARKLADQEASAALLFSKYAMTQNMVAYGAREKPVGTPSFEILYEAAKKSFIDRILINQRVKQMKLVWRRAMSDKEMGFSVVHDRHRDSNFKVTDEIRRRCDEMEELLADPTPLKFVDYYPTRTRIHTGLKDLVARQVKAEMVIDRKVIQRYPRSDGKGYAAFHWLPGATIKPVDEVVRQWAKKNEEKGKITRWSREKMSYATGYDLESSAFVQMVDGEIVAAFTEEEVSVHIANPSDEINRQGYGESPLEVSLDVTATFLYAWNYNKEIFKTNYPEAVLMVGGNIDKAGLLAFKQQILGEAGGPGNNWRLPVISTDDVNEFKIEAKKLRDTPKDMLFDQMLRFMILFKCASYGSHASNIGFAPDNGGGQHIFGPSSQEAEIDLSKDTGLRPMIQDMAEWLTDAIVKPRYPDLRVEAVGLEPEDEKQVIDLRNIRVKGWITRNEARMEEGLDPIGDVKDPRNPWNLPADEPVASAMTQMSMMNSSDDDGNDAGTSDDGGEKAQGGDDKKGRDSDVDYHDPTPGPRGGTIIGHNRVTGQPVYKSQQALKSFRLTLED